MVIEDGHAVDDPPECNDLHGDNAYRYDYFHPVWIIPFRSVPVKCNDRGVDTVQYDTDYHNEGRPSGHSYFFIPDAVCKQEGREKNQAENLEKEPVSIRGEKVLPVIGVGQSEEFKEKIREQGSRSSLCKP